MAKIRVYELARQLNTTNVELLEKLRELNISVKSHMSAVDEQAIALVKEVMFGEKSEVVVERRVRDTVIRRRRKLVKKSVSEMQEPTPEVEGEVPGVPEPVQMEEVSKPESEPEGTSPEITERVSEEERVVRLVEPEEPAIEIEKEGLEKPAVSPEVGKVEPEEPEPTKKAKARKKPRGKKEQAAKIIKLPEARPAALSGTETVSEIGVGETKRRKKPAGVDKKVIALEQKKTPHVPKGKKKREKVAPADKFGEDKRPSKKKVAFRKKEVLDRSDLYDNRVMRGRKTKKGRKGKLALKGEKTAITTPKAIKRRIKVDDVIVVSDLAKRMGIKASEVIRQLMTLGVMASMNQAIDFETAVVVAGEFSYEVERAAFEEENILRIEEDTPDKLQPRPPVVTIMGHVDHGKTSLLDAIRETSVIEGEAGGITQHIGAYYVTVDDRQIVFLDTPGHEAFTAMRARGAEVTDLVVLVVAADDGAMPQTIEAINHAKAANVPILAAVNKIDKPDAEPDRVKRELAEHGLSPEDWGGDTVFVNVSAKQRTGLDELLEMILLQADVLELKANPDKAASGRVVEAKLDVGRGAVATVLVQEGTLRAGDALVCGLHYGKIRAMVDDRGHRVDHAGPSIPVEIQGLAGVPMAGDEFVVVADEKVSKQVSMHRVQKQRAKDLATTSTLTLEKYYEQMQGGLVKDLNLIIRADVQGSIEALSESIQKIPSPEVKVNIVHSATGAMSESDIMLATVSNAIIVGFNVRPNPKVRDFASEQNVDIKYYNVIYNVVNDIKKAMVGLMEPTFEEHFVGRAEVRQTFHVAKVGTIAGSYVTEGKIERGQSARLLRDGVVVHDGKIGSLRRFKDDAKEVQSGYECGIGMDNFNDIKVNDIIECYRVEEVAPVLE
jgi:translation initiation factor IF-2